MQEIHHEEDNKKDKAADRSCYQGIHYKKMNTYYFVPFDSIDHITMNSKYLESEEPPYEGIRAIIESLKRFICDVIPFCSKKTLMFTHKLEYQECERNENENTPE